MTWVKVCGLRRREDVESAVSAGAEAVGFVIAEGSPRRITPQQAARLGEGIEATKVLVTRDLAPNDLMEAAAEAKVEAVQPHGRHARQAAAAARQAGLVVLLPVLVNGSGLDQVAEDVIVLLEGAKPGSGTTFDWSLAEDLTRPFVLSGGLGPDNVGDAIKRLRPWGVDASSGMETEPGVKDPGLIARFVAAAKAR